MSAVDKKSTTQEKIPRWEAELWSYIGSGDGINCPCYSICKSKREYGECPDKHKEQVKKLLGKRDVNLNSFDFIK